MISVRLLAGFAGFCLVVAAGAANAACIRGWWSDHRGNHYCPPDCGGNPECNTSSSSRRPVHRSTQPRYLPPIRQLPPDDFDAERRRREAERQRRERAREQAARERREQIRRAIARRKFEKGKRAALGRIKGSESTEGGLKGSKSAAGGKGFKIKGAGGGGLGIKKTDDPPPKQKKKKVIEMED